MQPRLLKHPARLAGASLLRLQDDERLVALAREGHDPAFAAIVDRYGPPLERYCARLLGPARAEDAVQQAFVNAHAAMRATDQELALKPWLYRIAHNAALNILRAARDEEAGLDMDRPAAIQTAEVVELRERLRETLASIQALPATQRDALLLRELEGRSHEEIAAALGVSEGGARQHLHRARVALRTAASAITPYPVLARVLSAAAAEGGRSGAELVSGAGMGAGAGAIKIAAGVLAAGAIAGGAVGVNHSSTPVADHATTNRSTTAPSEANGPSATPLDVADDQSAGATSRRDRGRGPSGARGRGRGHGSSGNGRPAGRDDSGRRGGQEHHGSGDRQGSSGGSSGGGTSGDGKTGDKSFGDGSGTSGSSGGSGSGDTTTDASQDGSATTTTTDASGSDGTSGSLDSSGSDGGSTTTTTTTIETSSSGGSSSDGGSSFTSSDG